MKYPDKLNIIGRIYIVTYIDVLELVDPTCRQYVLGQIDRKEGTIRVFRGDRSEYEIWTTIFHEIIHGILGENLAIDNCIKPDMEEDFVDSFAQTLLDTLVRNDLL